MYNDSEKPSSSNKEEEMLDTSTLSLSKRQLLAFFDDKSEPLLGTIRAYVQRSGIAGGDEVRTVALDIFQETVVEALAHADRFTPTRQPMAWLLGIAVNILRRKKADIAKHWQREVSFYQLSPTQAEGTSNQHLPDTITMPLYDGPEQTYIVEEQAMDLLSLVSRDDQRVLRLAILENFDRESLAQRLGTTPGAARVRLHRALGRLRVAWMNQQKDLQDGE